MHPKTTKHRQSLVGHGTKLWRLKTLPGASEFDAYRDESLDLPPLVAKVAKTVPHPLIRKIEDLHRMLEEHGDWKPLGSADEQKAGCRRNRRSLGTFSHEPCWRLVRAEKERWSAAYSACMC